MRQRDLRTLTTLVNWYVSEFIWTKYVVGRVIEVRYLEVTASESTYILTKLGVDIND